MNHDVMRRCVLHAAVLLIVCIVLGGSCAANAQSSSAMAEAKQSYMAIKDNLLKAAAKMPEEDYSFRTVPPVRTYGEMIAHVADVQTLLCSTAKGAPVKGTAAVKTSKNDLVAALKASFDICDPLFDQMNDTAAAEKVKVFGHDMSKLGVLEFDIAHDNEMYGTIVAFLRIKGIVPPSSEGRSM